MAEPRGFSLRPYEPPSWARDLKLQPTSRVERVAVLLECGEPENELGMSPTPLHIWSLPGVPSEFQVTVKREDLAGCTLTGNKVRKLEFLLADALQKGCDCVVTFGVIQSNHARATALAARQLGLQTHLIILSYSAMLPSEVPYRGNMLLDLLAGAKILLVKPDDISPGDHLKAIHGRMEQYAEKLRSEGHQPYVIPAGGASAVGVWGSIEIFREMMEQDVLKSYDDIVTAAGTGGTACGLAIGNYLTGSKVRVHAVVLHSSAGTVHAAVDSHLQELGVEGVASRDLVDIIEYSSMGKSPKEEKDLLLEVILKTGLPLDPIFTVKAVRGMLGEMRNNPTRFQGRRVLFLHTGGIFSLFDGRIDQAAQENVATSQIHNLSDILPD